MQSLKDGGFFWDPSHEEGKAFWGRQTTSLSISLCPDNDHLSPILSLPIHTVSELVLG